MAKMANKRRKFSLFDLFYLCFENLSDLPCFPISYRIIINQCFAGTACRAPTGTWVSCLHGNVGSRYLDPTYFCCFCCFCCFDNIDKELIEIVATKSGQIVFQPLTTSDLLPAPINNGLLATFFSVNSPSDLSA